MRWIWLGVAVVGLGCSRHGSATGAAPSANVLAAGSAPRVSLANQRQMLGCPVTVESAVTTITDVEGGVRLQVTSDSEAGTREIRSRTAHMLQMERASHDPNAGGDAAAKRAALGTATGPKEGTEGQSGRCPIMWRDAKLETAEVPGGSSFVLRPELASDVEWLRRQTRERHQKLAATP